MAKILRLQLGGKGEARQQVGRVHRDGSITFRGRKYSTLREVPPECLGLRPDVETHCQWRSLYRPIDPGRKR